MKRQLLCLIAALGAFAAVVPSAYAVTHHPKGEFAQFADCPLSNAEVEGCVYALTESGEFVVGNERVPITNTITLQGGFKELANETFKFYGAEDGDTISNSPQKVPGGLAGLIKCNEISNFIERIACEVVFENGVTGVNATTELAAPASSIGINLDNIGEQTGTALSLPVKVHLENPFLGSSCYIGTNASPIVIEFTTGTTSPSLPNKPITGAPGSASISPGGVITIKNNELVNNTFAAPGAEGCGGIFALVLDPIVDAKLGIPATSGHNTAILKGTLKAASSGEVKASE